MSFTKCECGQAGWCARHECFKTARQHYLCRVSPEQFQRWETGQASPTVKWFRRLPLRRCKHRDIDPTEQLPCDLCGNEGKLIPVYGCNVHGECAERRIGTRSERLRSMAICLTCHEYEPAESPVPAP